MGFTIPTLLQIKGLDDDDRECIWYAEAVGRIVKNGEYYYEGYYLVPSKTNPSYLVYDEAYEQIPEESVLVTLSVKNEGYSLAWEKMGILMKEGDDGTYFIKVGEPRFDFVEDEDDIGSVDSYSTESDDDRSNISDLIDDSEVIHSKCDELLNEQFRSWIPKDEKERRVKDFIQSLENKAAHEMDERGF